MAGVRITVIYSVTSIAADRIGVAPSCDGGGVTRGARIQQGRRSVPDAREREWTSTQQWRMAQFCSVAAPGMQAARALARVLERLVTSQA